MASELNALRWDGQRGHHEVYYLSLTDRGSGCVIWIRYQDPDGKVAYCYNSEVASLRYKLYERDRSEPTGWRLVDTLVAPGRAHSEYAQREPVPGLELQVR
jgi:hypothetical protein